MFDFETLRLIWWLLLGFLIISFAVTDGFDLGAAILMPIIARNEVERSIVLNTIRPFWEGNQIWIILGAGAIFAAWPFVYAVAFSGAYFAVLLLLLTMGISRPVSFKYRSKIPNASWRRVWDVLVFIGGFVPAIILGMLVGNTLLGLPFYFDTMLRINYSGTFWQLFNPFALWCGLTSLAMLVMHGGIYVALKTEQPIYHRAIVATRIAAFGLIISFAVGGFLIANYVSGYIVASPVLHYGYSNPLHKEVVSEVGAWLRNYSIYKSTIIAPLVGFLGAILVILMTYIPAIRWAFVFSAMSVTGVIATVGVSMFPFILPSSINLNSGLLVWDASSSRLTLLMMLVAVLIFMPIIMLYTAWVYRVLRGKVKAADIEIQDQQHVY